MTSDHHAHEAAAAGSPGVHTPTLYYSTYSLYSILVRHALQLGRTLDSDSAPDVRLHLVDMLKDEHLGEAYLKVNPMGQVSHQPVGRPGACQGGSGRVHT